MNVRANTAQAESGLRNVVSGLGNANSQATSLGSAFRKSFLDAMNSENSFASSLKSGLGGAFNYAKTQTSDFKDKVVTSAKSIKDGFNHPIDTIKSGLGKAIESVKGKFVSMARGAENAADATHDLGSAAGGAKNDVQNLGKAAEESSRKFGSLSAVIKGIGTAVTVASAAAGGFAAVSVKTGMDFDKSMAQVAATMGITMNQLNTQVGSVQTSFGHFQGTLRDYAQFMGANTAFSAMQAADALNYMALAGYDANTSMQMLPNVLNLAAAGNIELAAASDMITDAQSALGLSLAETTQMVDKMAAASSKSNTSVAQLGAAFLTIGGTAKNLAGGTTELATALGILADNGVKGSEGGTALRNIILSLSAPTELSTKAIKKLGLHVFDAAGNMRPLNEVFADLNKALSKMTQEQRTQALNKIFNKTDLKSVNALLATSSQRWNELSLAIDGSWYSTDSLTKKLAGLGLNLDTMKGNLAKLGVPAETFQKSLNSCGGDVMTFVNMLVEASNAGVGFDEVVAALGGTLDKFELGKAFAEVSGAAQAMADTQLDNLAGDVTLFKSALEGAQIVISDQLSPTLREFTQFGTNAVSQFTTAFKEHGLTGAMSELGTILSDGLAMIIDTLPKLVDAGMQLLGALGKGIIDNLPLLADAAAQIIVTLTSGIGKSLPNLIPAIVNTVTLIGQTLLNNLPQILNAGMQIISGLGQGIMNAIPLLANQLPDLVIQIVNFLGENLPAIAEQGIEILTSLGMGIVQAIPELVARLPEIINAITGSLSSSLPTILEHGVQLLVTLGTGIIQAIPDLITQLPQIITGIVGFVTENLPLIIGAGVQLVVQLGVGIIQAIPELIAQLPQLVEAIVGGLAELPGMMLDIGINIVKGLWDGIASMGSWITDQVTGFFGGMVDSVADFFGIHSPSTVFAEFGVNIVKGLWEGIVNMGAWIKEKVSGFFGGIVDSVKGLLGIHSPSTVFTEIGDNMALGVGEGFSKTMGAVSDKMQKAIPTELKLPDVISEETDLTYGIEPVVTNPEIAAVPDMTYGVEPVVAEPDLPLIPDLTYGIEPVVTKPEIAAVPDMTYGVEPVVAEPDLPFIPDLTYGVEPVEAIIPDISYMVNPIMADLMPEMFSDVFYNVKPVIENIEPSEFSNNQLISLVNSAPDLAQFLMGDSLFADVKGSVAVANDAADSMNNQSSEIIGSDEYTMLSSPAAFAPVVNVYIQGSANDESIENMSETLRSTVRELYDEFREEELERMALKNQYSFR